MQKILNFLIINYSLLFAIKLFNKKEAKYNLIKFNPNIEINKVESFKALDLWYQIEDYKQFKNDFINDRNYL